MMNKSDKKIIPISNESDDDLKEINILKRELYEYKDKWEKAQIELSENNIALEVLAKNIDKNVFNTKIDIARRLHSEILPLLKEIRNEKHFEKIRILTDLIIDKLILFIPSPGDPCSVLAMLTPMEMKIAAMIKDGFNSTDIARRQFISIDTVKTHRSNIRKKLALKNKRINLAVYLKSLFS